MGEFPIEEYHDLPYVFINHSEIILPLWRVNSKERKTGCKEKAWRSTVLRMAGGYGGLHHSRNNNVNDRLRAVDLFHSRAKRIF